MPDKEDVKTKAHEFLEVLAQKLREALGPNPKVVQQAVWWSPASSRDSQVIVQSKGSLSMLRSGGHEREVFDAVRVSAFYQVNLIDKGFPEQTELHNLLTAAGIPAQWIRFGFFLPLISAWCKLPEPLDLAQPFAQALLDEFAETVIDKSSRTRYRDAIVSADISGTAIILEDGLVIRPITEEELWELGSGTFSTPPFSLQLSPASNWCILDIELKHQLDDSPQIATKLYGIRDAVVANLAITAVGSFTLLPIGITAKFGPNATGTTILGSRMPSQFGSFPGMVPAPIDTNARQQLLGMWPRVKEIMLSPSHNLSLPLRRLVDGLGRTRLDDKIVDYAIGLEALLTHKLPDEPSPRLKPKERGATILEREGENKQRAVQDLNNFYAARHRIVHGGSVSKLDLRSLADSGERLLRRIWTWHLTNT